MRHVNMMFKIVSSLLVLVVLINILPSFPTILADSIDDSYIIKTIKVHDMNITIVWRVLREPDIIIRYCGLNYIYLEESKAPWFDVILEKYNISRYVGPPSWYKPGDLESEIKLSAERNATANKLEEEFERAGVRSFGWVGRLNFVYYFEWDPKVLGIYMYLGGVESRDKNIKLAKIRGLLESVSHILREYNISRVIIWEVYTTLDPDKVIGASYALERAIRKVKENAPETIKRLLEEWLLGASLDLVVGLSLAAKPPSEEVIEEFVKWIRDEMKYCEVPLVIVFNAYIPPAPIPIPLTVPLSPEPTKTETRTMATTKADSNESLNINTLITSIALVLVAVSTVLIIARRISISRLRYS